MSALFADAIRAAIGQISDKESENLRAALAGGTRFIPSKVDRPALAILRDELGRDATDSERTAFREKFKAAILS